MKKLLFFTLSFFIHIAVSKAQMGVNATGDAPNASAMLDVNSTTKGLLPPRMTSTQKNAIANPADGLLVFDTNTQSYWFRQSGTWTELPKAGSTSNYWSLSGAGGNEIKNTNSGGFWSANPVGLTDYSDDNTNSPTAPTSGAGTRLMWIPSRSAFRVGTILNNNSDFWDASNIGLFSTAMGLNTKASGQYSVSLGGNTIASGEASVAIGVATIASGNYSTAMGDATTALGHESTAIGHLTTVSGNNSTAMGYATTASGNYSTAMGNTVIASGIVSTAMGNYTNASGNYSTAIGNTTLASGNNSTAMGYNTTANAQSSLAIGTYNNDYYPANSTDVNRFLFTIGNGDVNTHTRRNCFEVRQTGTVQINHYTPVQDNPDRFGLRIKRDIATGNQFWTISHPSNENLDFHYGASGAFKAYIRQTDGAWVQSSDSRLKEQIKPVESVLEKVSQLNVSRYFYKTDTLHANQQMGLIAQEVLPLFPEFVTQNGQYYGINYGGLSVVAIKAIQELKEENETLKDSVKKLQLLVEKMLEAKAVRDK